MGAGTVTAGGVIGFVLSAIIVASLWIVGLRWLGGKVGENFGTSTSDIERSRLRGRVVGTWLGVGVWVISGAWYALHGGLR